MSLTLLTLTRNHFSLERFHPG